MTRVQRLLIVFLLFTTMVFLQDGGSKVPTVRLGDGFEQGIVFEGDEVLCVACNPLIFGERLNVNLACGNQLRQLPGIGDKIAQEIVEQRPIHSLEELDKIRGIGPVTLSKIESRIRFTP